MSPITLPLPTLPPILHRPVNPPRSIHLTNLIYPAHFVAMVKALPPIPTSHAYLQAGPRLLIIGTAPS